MQGWSSEGLDSDFSSLLMECNQFGDSLMKMNEDLKSLVQRFKKWYLYLYLYLYFLIEENLGEWKMRNMMTVTMRIPERLQSLLC